MAFRTIKDGEAVFPEHDNYAIRCCDCGLTHHVRIKVYRVTGRTAIGFEGYPSKEGNLQVGLMFFRAKRSTSAARRKDTALKNAITARQRRQTR